MKKKNKLTEFVDPTKQRKNPLPVAYAPHKGVSILSKKKLKNVMNKRGVTITHIARHFGIPDGRVKSWLYGKGIPSATEFIRLMLFFKFDTIDHLAASGAYRILKNLPICSEAVPTEEDKSRNQQIEEIKEIMAVRTAEALVEKKEREQRNEDLAAAAPQPENTTGFTTNKKILKYLAKSPAPMRSVYFDRFPSFRSTELAVRCVLNGPRGAVRCGENKSIYCTFEQHITQYYFNELTRLYPDEYNPYEVPDTTWIYPAMNEKNERGIYLWRYVLSNELYDWKNWDIARIPFFLWAVEEELKYTDDLAVAKWLRMIWTDGGAWWLKNTYAGKAGISSRKKAAYNIMSKREIADTSVIDFRSKKRLLNQGIIDEDGNVIKSLDDFESLGEKFEDPEIDSAEERAL